MTLAFGANHNGFNCTRTFASTYSISNVSDSAVFLKTDFRKSMQQVDTPMTGNFCYFPVLP